MFDGNAACNGMLTGTGGHTAAQCNIAVGEGVDTRQGLHGLGGNKVAGPVGEDAGVPDAVDGMQLISKHDPNDGVLSAGRCCGSPPFKAVPTHADPELESKK